MRRWLMLVPLAVFLGMAWFLYRGLYLDPTELPSAMIDKPFPAFSLPAVEGDKTLTEADLKGKPALVNVWATWCISCRVEHPVLVELAKTRSVLMYGLNYKDQPDKAVEWLARLGNPYLSSLADTNGLVGIDLGVYGVPETFVIDKDGMIRYKHIGPVTDEALQGTILPLMRRLGA